MYTLLTVIVVSMLLGMFLGCWLLQISVNYMMRLGAIDIYVKGYKLERWRMWS